MKHFLAVIMSMILLAAGATLSHAQETLPVCNEDSGLAWEMNSEVDLHKYNIYSSNNPIDVDADNVTLILMEVLHDTTAAEVNADGTKSVTTSLMSTLAEGPKYFRVSAVDKSGNESGFSNEASCSYNLKPGIPTGVTIILKLKKK